MEAIKKKARRGEQEMFTLIESFKASGMSQHLFCEQHNLAYSVFQYWLRKFKKESSVCEAGFVEMKISSPSRSQAEIVFPSGIKVVLSSADVALIRSLVL